VRQVMNPLVAEGYVLRKEGSAAIRDAARSDVAK
jgi:hypothetical protein